MREPMRSQRRCRPWPVRVDEAKLCLSSEDKAWSVRRDYTSCYEKLDHSALAALQIRQNQEQWAQ